MSQLDHTFEVEFMIVQLTTMCTASMQIFASATYHPGQLN